MSLNRIAVEGAVRDLIANLDYDLHLELIEHNDYPALVTTFIEEYEAQDED